MIRSHHRHQHIGVSWVRVGSNWKGSYDSMLNLEMNCSISVNPENLSTKINPLICHLHADFESRCVQKTIFQVMRGINFQIYQYIGCCILFTISSVFATVNIYQHAPKFVNFIQSLKLSALCWFQNQVFQLIPEFCKLNLIRLFFILNKTHWKLTCNFVN